METSNYSINSQQQQQQYNNLDNDNDQNINQNQNLIQILPNELLLHIMTFYPPHESIPNGSLICRHMYNLLSGDRIWQTYVNNFIPHKLNSRSKTDKHTLYNLFTYEYYLIGKFQRNHVSYSTQPLNIDNLKDKKLACLCCGPRAAAFRNNLRHWNNNSDQVDASWGGTSLRVQFHAGGLRAYHCIVYFGNACVAEQLSKVDQVTRSKIGAKKLFPRVMVMDRCLDRLYVERIDFHKNRKANQYSRNNNKNSSSSKSSNSKSTVYKTPRNRIRPRGLVSFEEGAATAQQCGFASYVEVDSISPGVQGLNTLVHEIVRTGLKVPDPYTENVRNCIIS
eukprot:gb/GECH01013734.1/.p1 GENE.gb/GECH01013734.1/~~gb/GECH01013734.1/.p1  ORF type:complete len:336 (+),score=84.32 gb/GECH01013734.1/:1-1008(+)